MATPTPTIYASEIAPLTDNILVVELEGRMLRTKTGIIIPDDNMKEHGIKPRWGLVWSVGPEVEDVKPGQWVFIEHGRWTNKIELDLNGERIDCWKIDLKGVLLVSDSEERPAETVEHKF